MGAFTIRKHFVVLCLLVSIHGTAGAAGPYENPPTLTLEEAIPGLTPKMSIYEFKPEVTNDGMSNHFFIYSQFGMLSVVGNEMARERAHELVVISLLEDVKKGEAFGEGMKAAGKSTLANIRTLVTDPVNTLSGVPQGVNRFFGNMYRKVKDGGKKNQYEDSTAKQIVGFSKVKRTIAVGSGVDPYSSNERLQQVLDDVAWASYAGGMSISVVKTLVIPPVVSTPLTVTDVTVQVSNLVENESPTNLRAINTKKLRELGASDLQIDALLSNQWYSPMRQTVLAEALYGMRHVKAIASYLDRAVDAASEEQAFFMQRSAEILRGYHEKQVALKELYCPAQLPMAENSQGKLVGAFAIDYLAWTERADETSRALRQELPSRLSSADVELWLSGKASATAKENLAKQQVTIVENALEKLFPPKKP